MNNHRRFQRIGIITSYVIGLPLGLGAVIFTLLAPAAISGEGLPTMGLVGLYGKAIPGLIAAFIVALWYAGKSIAGNLEEHSVLTTSFKYSVRVNLIIWTVFIILTIIQHFGLFSIFLLIPPVIAFVVSVGFTTISIGLLICWIVNMRIKQIEKQQQRKATCELVNSSEPQRRNGSQRFLPQRH